MSIAFIWVKRSFRLFLQHNKILCCSRGLTFNVYQFQIEIDRIWIRNTYGFIHSHIKSGAIHHLHRHNIKEHFASQSFNEKEVAKWTKHMNIHHTSHTLIYDAVIMIDVYVQQNFFSFFFTVFRFVLLPVFVYFHFRLFVRFFSRPTWSEQTAVCKNENRMLFGRLMISNVWERKTKKYGFSENATVNFEFWKEFRLS